VIAQESAKAPILATNATTSSVSSYGAASIVGVAALVAALGIGIAAALGAFEEGGFTGSGRPGDIAGVVHRGEFVFSAPAVSALGAGNLSAMHEAASGGGGGGIGGQARIVIVDDNRRLKDMENDAGFRNMIVRMNAKNAWRYRA
jgi:phage-related minor tail protein